MNERIAVMLGGTSSEREVSIKSGKAVARALEQAGHDVVKCLLDSDDLSALDGHDVDAVFVAMHGRFGEDGGIQALLEEAGIAYTGCGPHASARAMDKVVSKECFVEAGLPVARFMSVTAGYARDKVETFLEAVGTPVVVKPSAEGSSVGVTIVQERGEVHGAIQATFEYGADVMVEEFIEGREITVGILGGRALPIVEILPRGGFFDYTSKYVKGQSEYITGPKLPGEVTNFIQILLSKISVAITLNSFNLFILSILVLL